MPGALTCPKWTGCASQASARHLTVRSPDPFPAVLAPNCASALAGCLSHRHFPLPRAFSPRSAGTLEGSFHDGERLYPVGYCTEWHHAAFNCVFVSKILHGGNEPIFRARPGCHFTRPAWRPGLAFRGCRTPYTCAQLDQLTAGSRAGGGSTDREGPSAA